MHHQEHFQQKEVREDGENQRPENGFARLVARASDRRLKAQKPTTMDQSVASVAAVVETGDEP